ncbi:hypothetical protein RIR_jg27932.t1 [Rhizophagus irregularis DAOM 181602=DAOM 197198]|nr:hypothetical protein RIR_jg27932.t1 [Rhizophagus irregularis DAOM 181602=DAOM 197198]
MVLKKEIANRYRDIGKDIFESFSFDSFLTNHYDLRREELANYILISSARTAMKKSLHFKKCYFYPPSKNKEIFLTSPFR